MFGFTRWQIDDIFTLQREVDRVFHDAWTALPSRPSRAQSASLQVSATDDQWHIDVPLPGVDPQHVNLEVAGNTLSLSVREPGRDGAGYEQSFTVPQFLDVDRLKATHKHGMLRLTLPIKESLKPRRVAIDVVGSEQKQLVAA